MPAYTSSPFKPSPLLLVAGTPGYLLGSYDDKSSPTFGNIISDSAATTTGTINFLVISGPVPLVGDSITVVGAARSTNFNTTGTVLTVVTESDAGGIQNGVVTVTYTISSTTLSTAADSGQVICSRVEVGEALVTGSSVPAAVSFNPASPQNGRTLTANVSFPSLPTTVTSFDLQGANFDRDGEYVTLTPTTGGSSGHLASISGSTVSGGSASYGDDLANYRFYRFTSVGVSGGTNPTVVAKIEV